MILLNCQTAFTQQRVLVVDGDTLICNSVEEQAFWVKQYFRVQELEELDSINLAVISYKDSIISNDQEIILKQTIVIENTEEIVEFQGEQINTLNNELTEQKKATRRQKFYKWVAVTIGASATSVMTYLYLTK